MRKLLFICVKNSSRSQMAEALVKLARAKDVEVQSAGIDPGECVHPNAVKAMKELGYDLRGEAVNVGRVRARGGKANRS
jgi:protein-tyrosine-phosphatase